jgi:diphthamide synthase (EF-2-diphthine--ammonia ligase)
MLAAGLDAVLVTTDPRKIDPTLCGRRFSEVVPLLPPDVDPCGENGEFHTFAFAGPMFSGPIEYTASPVTRRGGFDHVDLGQRR